MEGKMKKTTLKIEGMMCAMCEAHICDVIRNTIPQAKKVSASRKKGEATFLCEETVDADQLKDAIAATAWAFHIKKAMVQYDSQEVIYNSFFEELDAAISTLLQAYGHDKDNLDLKRSLNNLYLKIGDSEKAAQYVTDDYSQVKVYLQKGKNEEAKNILDNHSGQKRLRT